MRRATRVFCLCLLALAGGFAIAGQAWAASPQARRDELAKVQEALADPDPMQRLANMEAIVKAGDPVKTQVALRTALASDDADLRGMAMRAYLATRRRITFDVLLPPAVQKQYDAAQGDPAQMRALVATNRYLPFLERIGFKLDVVLARYDFPQDTGTLESGRRDTAPFTIKGDGLESLLNLRGIGDCYIDFTPTAKLTLDGTMACQGAWPKLAITTKLF